MDNASGKSVLIVEDERDVVDLLALNLRKAGFKIMTATDGAAGLQKARNEKPDFIILDLMLPKMPGLEVCKILKSDPATQQVPILMLTAKAEEIDRIVGLEFGADDYVTKPFDMSELLARLRAALRHGLQAVGEAPVFRSGPLTVDMVSRRVLRHGAEIHLSPKEYGLLRFLVSQAGRVVTHRQILEEVWGPANIEDVQYLRVLMRALRKKIEPESETQIPQLITTESGVGYRLMQLPPED